MFFCDQIRKVRIRDLVPKKGRGFQNIKQYCKMNLNREKLIDIYLVFFSCGVNYDRLVAKKQRIVILFENCSIGIIFLAGIISMFIIPIRVFDSQIGDYVAWSVIILTLFSIILMLIAFFLSVIETMKE